MITAGKAWEDRIKTRNNRIDGTFFTTKCLPD
jgi:hypothetical protein